MDDLFGDDVEETEEQISNVKTTKPCSEVRLSPPRSSPLLKLLVKLL
jgi:hypothetical protein